MLSNKSTFFDPTIAQKMLQAQEHPLSYFDLESISYPIPRYPKSCPYQQLPFQFSCHIQRAVGSDLEHLEFLYDGIDDPRAVFIQKMLEVLPFSGSIVVYHQEFEVSRLTELARDFPEHGRAIQEIILRVVDLEAVITETTCHPDFFGSFSIKKMAPALLGEQVSYNHFEVSDGIEAMLSYREMLSVNTLDFRKMEIRKNLLDYCKQDTLLMVLLHRWLLEQIATSAG